MTHDEIKFAEASTQLAINHDRMAYWCLALAIVAFFGLCVGIVSNVA